MTAPVSRRVRALSAWMAMAGPAANIIILLAAALLIHVGMEWGVFTPGSTDMMHIVEAREPGKLWAFLASLLSIAFSLQVVLIPFNLLPLPPLDGSAIPLFFLSGTAAAKYQELLANPTTRLFGVIIAWQMFGRIFQPIP